MKKQIEARPKRVLPVFATEAEESKWWFKNRGIQGEELLAAVRSGEVQALTKEKLRERLATSKKAPATARNTPGPPKLEDDPQAHLQGSRPRPFRRLRG